jgi:MYXO-CTERM domain-containing protein
MGCAETFRFRWGKRWESEARASRAVPVAIDLLQKARDTKVLTDALESPLVELGLVPSRRAVAAPSASPVASAQGRAAKGSCGVSYGSRSEPAWVFAALVLALVARRRRP